MPRCGDAGSTGAMGAGSRPGARAHVPCPHPARTGALARALAGRAGLVGRTGGHGPGTRPAYRRGVAGRFRAGRARRGGLRAERRSPPVLDAATQADLTAAVQASPRAAGIPLANWNWKAVRAWVDQRVDRRLSRSSCRHYLQRLGFVYKRPKKRLLKADAARRAAFVREYALLLAVAAQTGARIFFVDEAHFYADADLRGKWVLRGEPALVDSTSPRWGEKVSYYSAVCLETGAVEVLELEGNSSAQTSVQFLQQLRAHHPDPLIVIWDNGPAHGGEALRAYLHTPDLQLRLVRLPAYSPDFNADE